MCPLLQLFIFCIKSSASCVQPVFVSLSIHNFDILSTLGDEELQTEAAALAAQRHKYVLFHVV